VDPLFAASTTLVSVGNSARPGGDAALVGDAPTGNGRQSLSGDGRRIVFDSQATNFVADDENGFRDVFLRDLEAEVTERISLDAAGLEADGDSFEPSISGDGRFVAFTSEATDLVLGDSNGVKDVFVRDLESHTTSRISVDSGGSQADAASFAPSISGDGRYVAFASDAANLAGGDSNGTTQIYVHDRESGATTRASVDANGSGGNLASLDPYISSDGRYVAFHSFADTLVPGDANDASDVFVRDRQQGSTSLESLFQSTLQSFENSDSASISDDGRFVAFLHDPEDCGHPCIPAWMAVVRDRHLGTTRVVSPTAPVGYLRVDGPVISRSGELVAYRDERGFVVLQDLLRGGSWDVGSHSHDAEEGAPSVSGNDRFVAFGSELTTFVPGPDPFGFSDLFLFDRDPIFDDGFESGDLLSWN
jgi:Tol biopolymer transport system component